MAKLKVAWDRNSSAEGRGVEGRKATPTRPVPAEAKRLVRPAAQPSANAIDPACGMTVDPTASMHNFD
jgi:hypothetical protein